MAPPPPPPPPSSPGPATQGNDGLARILVPQEEWLKPADRRPRCRGR